MRSAHSNKPEEDQGQAMPHVRCSICSRPKSANESPGSCVACDAIRAGAPPIDSEAVPSILKEHHASFLRLFLMFFAAWMLIALWFAFWAWYGS